MAESITTSEISKESLSPQKDINGTKPISTTNGLSKPTDTVAPSPTTVPGDNERQDSTAAMDTDMVANTDAVANNTVDTSNGQTNINDATDASKQAAVPIETEPSVDKGSVQSEMLRDQLPEATDPGEADAAEHAAKMAGVVLPDAPTAEPLTEPVSTTSAAGTDDKANEAITTEPVTGDKRKVDEIDSDVIDGAAADDEEEEGSPIEEEGAEKKIKANDGAAVPQRKNSKAGRFKKTATPIVGRTARQTRSQGPIA